MTDLGILVSYAHPDDEQVVTGILRLCSDNNIRTAILCATRGEAGEIADPSLATPETLGQVREQELRNAAALLGVNHVYFLDYRDSGMGNTAENVNPHAFINADPQEAVGRIVKVIRQFKPTVIVTFDEIGGYGHPDHLASYRWTTEAFHASGDKSRYPEAGPAFTPSRLFYSSFSRAMVKSFVEFLRKNNSGAFFENAPIDQFGLADERITNRVNVTQYVDLKRQAVFAHKTQMIQNAPFANIPEEMWKEWIATEQYAFIAGVALPPDSDPGDLFAGLR